MLAQLFLFEQGGQGMYAIDEGTIKNHLMYIFRSTKYFQSLFNEVQCLVCKKEAQPG